MGVKKKENDYAKSAMVKKCLGTTGVDETALDEHLKTLHTSTGIFNDSG